MATQVRPAAALRILAGWQGLKRIDAEVLASRRRPNVFAILRRSLRVEGVHSDVLRWLLDPSEWHGLGGRFAQNLLSEIVARCGQPLSARVEIIAVEREFDTTRGPVDLLVRCRSGVRELVVAIENKIDAGEGHRQLWRYCEGLKARFPTSEVFLTILAPNEIAPDPVPEGAWTLTTYDLVTSSLEAALTAPPAGSEAAVGATVARHYLETLRADIMGESNQEIDALCRQLYEEHRGAWHVIRRRLPTWRDEFHDLLGAKVCASLNEQHGADWAYAVRRDRYVAVFRPSWRAFGDRASESILGLSHGSPIIPSVHFRLAAGSPALDDEQGGTFEARLKVGKVENSELGNRVSAAVAGVLGSKAERHAGKTQFTHGLKTSKRLPSPHGQAADVSAPVVAWFAGLLSPFVSAIDQSMVGVAEGEAPPP